MSEFTEEIRVQVAQVTAALHEAEAAGDDYLVGVTESELVDLARLAQEHDLRIPELDSVRGAA